MASAGLLPSDAAKHVNQQLHCKLQTMKRLLQAKLKLENLAGGGGNDTMEDFGVAFKHFKNDTSHRLKTAYSYDIKDDATYRQVQKIEKRMRKYYEHRKQWK